MIKQGDFVEVEYTGKLKDEGLVFDTTDEKTAKEAGIHNEQMNYGSVVICVGQAQLLKGLDNALADKELNNDYSVDISAEDGFGKKNAKLIQLIATSKFKKEGINPMKGMQVNVDGVLCTIKTVSGGRTLVDFNHPLSGKELVYSFKIKRVVEDDAEKVKEYLKVSLSMKNVETKLENGKLTATLEEEISDEAKEKLGNKVKELIPAVKELEFKKK